MADDKRVTFILDLQDLASGKFGNAVDSFGSKIGDLQGKTKKIQEALAVAGAATSIFLGASVKAAADQEEAITKAARATADAGGGFDNAKKSIGTFAAEMEKQGFDTQKTTDAITLLVTKGGRDLPTAMKEAADFMSAADARGISLQKAIAALNKDEGEGQLIIEGANKKRLESLTTNEKFEQTMIRVGNVMVQMGEKLMPLVEAGLDFINGLLDGFEKLDQPTKDILLTIGAIVGIIVSIVGAIAGFALAVAPLLIQLQGLGITLGTVITFLSGFVAPIAGAVVAIGSLLTGIGELLIILAAIAAVIAIVATAWNENWFGIQDTFAGVVDTVTGLIDGLLETINTFVTKGIGAFLDFNSKLESAFKELIGKALNWGKDLVANILKGIKEQADKIVSGAVKAAGDAAKGLIGLTTGATGLVASGVTPLAEGGIISKPTLAILGEGGENEYVIPQSKMNEWMGGGSITVIQNITNPDPETVARIAMRMAMQELSGSNSDAMVSSRVV